MHSAQVHCMAPLPPTASVLERSRAAVRRRNLGPPPNQPTDPRTESLEGRSTGSAPSHLICPPCPPATQLALPPRPPCLQRQQVGQQALARAAPRKGAHSGQVLIGGALISAQHLHSRKDGSAPKLPEGQAPTRRCAAAAPRVPGACADGWMHVPLSTCADGWMHDPLSTCTDGWMHVPLRARVGRVQWCKFKPICWGRRVQRPGSACVELLGRPWLNACKSEGETGSMDERWH